MKKCKCGNNINEYRTKKLKYTQCYSCRKKTAKGFVTSMTRISDNLRGVL